MRRRLWPLAVAAFVVGGVVLRFLVYHLRSGTLDGDEAVVGLMAESFLRGEWRAFYWGQHYAGTPETALVALPVAILGPTTLAVKLMPVILSAVVSLLVWRVARRLLEERLAVAAALATWVAPGAWVWWSLKERGFYWVSLVLGLLLVLAAQRLVERRGQWSDALTFGLAAGLGFWCSPTVVYFLVPAGLWVVVRRQPPLRWLTIAVPAAILGALPWLWHNVEQSWASLESPPQPEHVSHVVGLGRLAWRTLPMMLNLRYPIGEQWLSFGAVIYVAVMAWLLVAALRRRDRPTLVLGGLAAFPLLYVAFPGRWFVGEGRYALFVVPFLTLALAWAARRPAIVLVLAAGSSVLSWWMVRPIGPEPPRYAEQDVAALEEAGVDHLWADYRRAYRFMFLSDGDLTVSPYLSSRNDEILDDVREHPTPGFLYERGDPRIDVLQDTLDVPSRRIRTPNFVAVLASGRVDPDGLPPGLMP